MATTKTKYRRTSKGIQVRQKNLAERLALVEKPFVRVDHPDFNPGDTIKVHVRIKEGEKERIQIFEGVVIRIASRGTGRRAITVRKISHGVGVERIFMETSPKVAKIEIAQAGRVRRAKLYYLRGLEGKAARVERQVKTLASVAASEAAKDKSSR